MRFSLKSNTSRRPSAFTLVEMVAVVAIIVILMGAGVSLLGGTGAKSRKAGSDMLEGLIEQARTTAITRRSYVVLAIAEPGDLPAGDERCQIGLFKVNEWPGASTSPLALTGELVSRWQTLNTGTVLVGGNVDGVANPLDNEQVTLNYGGPKHLSVNVHVIAFNPRGGLHYPSGSMPIALRIAEGGYRSGKATRNPRGSENRLKIGRVTARPYQIDG